MTGPSGKRPQAIADLQKSHGEIMAMLSEGQQQQQQQRQQPSGWGGFRPPSPSPRGAGAAGAALSTAIPGAMGVPPALRDFGGPQLYTYNAYSPDGDGKCARCGQAEGDHYHHANGCCYCPRVGGGLSAADLLGAAAGTSAPSAPTPGSAVRTGTPAALTPAAAATHLGATAGTGTTSGLTPVSAVGTGTPSAQTPGPAATQLMATAETGTSSALTLGSAVELGAAAAGAATSWLGGTSHLVAAGAGPADAGLNGAAIPGVMGAPPGVQGLGGQSVGGGPSAARSAMEDQLRQALLLVQQQNQLLQQQQLLQHQQQHPPRQQWQQPRGGGGESEGVMVRQLQEATQLLQLQRQYQQQPPQQHQRIHQQQQQQQQQQHWPQLGYVQADGGCGPAPPLDRGNQAAADPLGTLGGLGRPPWGNPSIYEASAGFLGQPPAYGLPLGSMGPTAGAVLSLSGPADSSEYFRALGRGGTEVGPPWAQSGVEPAAVPPPYAPLPLIGNVGLVPAGVGQRAADTDWRYQGGGALSSSLPARAEHLCPPQQSSGQGGEGETYQ